MSSTDNVCTRQWLFSLSSLEQSPSRTLSNIPLARELYERMRGIEYLFRVGVQLQLSMTAMLTAATYFHRFYMRFSLEDLHHYEAAAASIFLSTKAEECGRRLRDVAYICMYKAGSTPVPALNEEESPELSRWQGAILKAEELFLEALCFDFDVHHPHKDLADFFDSFASSNMSLQEAAEDFAWSIATDSYRTPLCILYPSQVIASASLTLGLAVNEGPNGLTIDDLLSAYDPNDSDAEFDSKLAQLAPSTQILYRAMRYFHASPVDVTDTIVILLQFYCSQGMKFHKTASEGDHFLSPLINVLPPSVSRVDVDLYPAPGESNGRHDDDARPNGVALNIEISSSLDTSQVSIDQQLASNLT